MDGRFLLMWNRESEYTSVLHTELLQVQRTTTYYKVLVYSPSLTWVRRHDIVPTCSWYITLSCDYDELVAHYFATNYLHEARHDTAATMSCLLCVVLTADRTHNI